PLLSHVAGRELKVRVRVVSSSLTFDAYINMNDGTAELTLSGELSDAAEPAFRTQLDRLVPMRPKRVVIRMENLSTMSTRAARALDFISSKLGMDEDIWVVGANEHVRKTLQDVGIWEAFKAMDTYDAGVLAGAGT